MKKITFILLSTLLFSCERDTYPKYAARSQEIIPDSLKEKYLDRINDLVKSTNNRLTAGDYEDPEDVIVAAKKVAFEAYAVNTPCLRVNECSGCGYDYIPVNELTREQKIIYEMTLISQQP